MCQGWDLICLQQLLYTNWLMRNMIFEEEDEEYMNERSRSVSQLPDHNNNHNMISQVFLLSDEHRSNLNKRLPKGFAFLPMTECDNYRKNKFQISPNDYRPSSNERKPAQDVIKTVLGEVWEGMAKLEPKKRRFVNQSYEGRSRQMEKIKNIIVRFRKHPKHQVLSAYLNKVGLIAAINEIQSENKRSLLNIDVFRERMMLVLETAKKTTYEQGVVEVIDEMMEELQCYCEQARKAEFEKNIDSIQKSIDKITRFVTDQSETMKSIGLYYSKKRRKAERTEPYSEKQLIHIASLIHKLPPAYLIGIWEIIAEKPFCDIEENCHEFRLESLPLKKQRQIQLYVKGKHSLLFRSRDRKQEKIYFKTYGVYRQKNDGEEEMIEEEESDDKSNNNAIVKKQANVESPFEQRHREEQESYVDSEFNRRNKDRGDDLFKNEEEEVVVGNVEEPADHKRDLKSLLKVEQNQSNVQRGMETPKFKQMTAKMLNEEDREELSKPVFGKAEMLREISEEIDSSDSSMITDEDESDF